MSATTKAIGFIMLLIGIIVGIFNAYLLYDYVKATPVMWICFGLYAVVSAIGVFLQVVPEIEEFGKSLSTVAMIIGMVNLYLTYNLVQVPILIWVIFGLVILVGLIGYAFSKIPVDSVKAISALFLLGVAIAMLYNTYLLYQFINATILIWLTWVTYITVTIIGTGVHKIK